MAVERRVVVTGMGVISPVGNSVNEFWESLVNGKSGIGIITRFDPSGLKSRIAGEVKNFNPEPIIDAKEVRRIDLFSQYALCSAAEAVEQSGISFENEDPFRTGVICGSGIGGINVLEKQIEIYLNKGPSRISPSPLRREGRRHRLPRSRTYLQAQGRRRRAIHHHWRGRFAPLQRLQSLHRGHDGRLRHNGEDNRQGGRHARPLCDDRGVEKQNPSITLTPLFSYPDRVACRPMATP